jgi:proteasome component ECM29
LSKLLTEITVLKEHLSKIPALIGEVSKTGSRPVQDALYTGLGSVFGKFRSQWSQRANNDQPLSDASELKESLEELADRLLFREFDLSVESLRTKRAQAADEYITAFRQAGFGVRDPVRLSIERWLIQERAEPVQRILNSALRKLDE